MDLRKRVLGREPARQMLYLRLRSIFVGYHLGADRLDMAHSVETRLPYLDHHLFEGAGRIPINMLARDGRQKHFLREVVRPYVSEAVYVGAKQPFYAPPSAAEPGTSLNTMTQDLFHSQAAAKHASSTRKRVWRSWRGYPGSKDRAGPPSTPSLCWQPHWSCCGSATDPRDSGRDRR